MAYFYVSADRDQLFLLPMSMRDWLAEGHLAWFVIDVVAQIDTSAFHARHPNDGPGRPAYDPDLMLALLFYAYIIGLRSSRRIEAACRTDAAYRVICGNHTPDHATIARFLVDHEQAIEAVFVDVLRLCAAAGLVSVGTIAIDGTKLGSDAALDANHSAEWIRAEVARILTEALATDAAEDAQPALFAGEALPAELSTRSGRL
jgi:transposase